MCLFGFPVFSKFGVGQGAGTLNQQACGSTSWSDRLTGLLVALLLFLVYYYVECAEYSYQCSPFVVSRNLHGKGAADGYGAITRLYPPGSQAVTLLDLGVN